MSNELAAWLFLAVSIAGALLVWNVHLPLRLGSRTAFASFFVGWLTAELAVHHIFWQAVATLGFVAAGALAHPAGQLALGLAVVQWAALGAHYARGARVRDRVEHALTEALGPDFESELPAEVRAALMRRVDWGAIAAPFPLRWGNVERLRDFVYGREGPFELRLDLYRPRGMAAGEQRPVVFYVHGGAWVIGTKRTQGLPLCQYLAQHGFVCVNVNYRLSPHATFPEHLIDLKRALAWVRKEGPALGCDPSFVAVTGGSAGGHLAALLALTANDPAYQPGFEDADTSVQAAVPIYGVYDWTPQGSGWRQRTLLPFIERHVMKARYADDPARFEAASPRHRVHAGAPPFLVVHGEADSLVPVEEAREFVRALRECSRAPVALLEVPGAQHAFEIFPSLRSDLTRQGIERFLLAAVRAHERASALP